MNLALKASLFLSLIFQFLIHVALKKKFRVTDSYVYLINQRAFSNLFFYVYALGDFAILLMCFISVFYIFDAIVCGCMFFYEGLLKVWNNFHDSYIKKSLLCLNFDTFNGWYLVEWKDAPFFFFLENIKFLLSPEFPSQLNFQAGSFSLFHFKHLLPRRLIHFSSILVLSQTNLLGLHKI